MRKPPAAAIAGSTGIGFPGLTGYHPPVMIHWGSRDTFHLTAGYQPLVRELGLDAAAIFTHPDIRVWRSITERENATLDATRADGTPIRLHIKRYHPTRAKVSPAEQEARGIRLLQAAGIPTVPLVGYGALRDGRAFILSEDLAGYAPADKTPLPPDRLVEPIADLAARLHAADLHHRDLYLCHFFVNDQLDVRLIDAGRVRRLPRWPLRKRWVVKDLAQTCYSMTDQGWPEALWCRFIERYVSLNGHYSARALARPVAAKVRRITRHDQNLRLSQPARNVSLPE